MATIRLFNVGTIVDLVHDGSEVPTAMPRNVSCLARIEERGRFCYRTNPMHREEIELYGDTNRGLYYAHGKKNDLEVVLGELALSTTDHRYYNMIREIRRL